MIERSAGELLASLAQGEVSAESLTGQFLDAIRRLDPQVRAFLHVDEADALNQACAVDEKRRRGEPVGLLGGLPVAVKDVLCIKGGLTTCGSKILQNYRPPYDAHVIERLRAADAVLIGKSNCDDFAMGSSTENSAHPRRLQRRLGGGRGGVRGAAGARH
jgi:aspartyl-tRNA(Asn)/glutamyl-tRNA(Gln) amidotransferase subunit A